MTVNEQHTEQYTALRRSLSIHLQALHRDAQGQPEKATESGELMAEAKAQSKRARVDLEEAKATADAEIRANHEKFGLAKVTESAVSNAVTNHPEVRKLNQVAIDAEEWANKCDSLFVGFHHRKAMLQIEVELFRAEYWGEVHETQMNGAGGTAEDAKAGKAGKVGRVEKRRRDAHNG